MTSTTFTAPGAILEIASPLGHQQPRTASNVGWFGVFEWNSPPCWLHQPVFRGRLHRRAPLTDGRFASLFSPRWLLYGNNSSPPRLFPSSNAIGPALLPDLAPSSLDEWLYNGGPYAA